MYLQKKEPKIPPLVVRCYMIIMMCTPCGAGSLVNIIILLLLYVGSVRGRNTRCVKLLGSVAIVVGIQWRFISDLVYTEWSWESDGKDFEAFNRLFDLYDVLFNSNICYIYIYIYPKYSCWYHEFLLGWWPVDDKKNHLK